MLTYRNLALVGVSLISLATPAFAAEAPASDNPSASNDIIVEARRKGEDVQDVPLTVNALKQDTLTKLQIRDFKDVASLVPGLALTPSADNIQPSTTLRGVNYDVTASGIHGTVAYYQNDGLAVATTVFMSMYDIAQIEVLRGPQGTLRGESVPSGSITLVTTKPNLDDVGGYVNGTATDLGGANVNGAVNLPVLKGVLAIRVAGLFNDDEANRIRSINEPSFKPYRHQRSERVAVRFDPIDSVDIIGTYDHGLMRGQYFDQVESSSALFGVPHGADPTPLLTPNDRSSVETHPWNTRLEFDSYNLQAQWAFAGQKLNYVFNLTTQHANNRGEGDIGAALFYYPGLGVRNSEPTDQNLFFFGNTTLSDSKFQYHELRLSSDERVLGMFDYVIGGAINKQKTVNHLGVQFPAFSVTSPALLMSNYFGVFSAPLPPGIGRDLENSLFANLTAHFGEATELSGGLRYIDWKHSDDFGNPFEWKPVIYNFSLKHRFNENIMVYAATGSSWRIPQGTNPIILQFSGQTTTPTDPYLASLAGVVPETSKSYEVGFKSDWLDKRAHFNVTYYHQDYKNYTLSTSPGLPICVNTGPTSCGLTRTVSSLSVGVPAKVDGVEAELAFQVTPDFSFGANASYALAKVSNGQVPCNDPTDTLTYLHQISQCPTNQRAGIGAPFSATVQAEYSHAITEQYNGFLRGLLTYYGNSQNDPNNPYDDVKAYGIMNLFAGVRASNGAWEITGYVKNLFNTKRVLSANETPEHATVNPFTAPALFFSSYNQITMTAPREAGINFRYAFGSR